MKKINELGIAAQKGSIRLWKHQISFMLNHILNTIKINISPQNKYKWGYSLILTHHKTLHKRSQIIFFQLTCLPDAYYEIWNHALLNYDEIYNHLYTKRWARILRETPKQNTLASRGGVFASIEMSTYFIIHHKNRDLLNPIGRIHMPPLQG